MGPSSHDWGVKSGGYLIGGGASQLRSEGGVVGVVGVVVGTKIVPLGRLKWSGESNGSMVGLR